MNILKTLTYSSLELGHIPSTETGLALCQRVVTFNFIFSAEAASGQLPVTTNFALSAIGATLIMSAAPGNAGNVH